MKAIRGATTIKIDCAEDIKTCVKELLNEIKSSNNLSNENVICIMFSSTDDIHSYYPAKAAREAGFFNCPLFSSLEPDIVGSLKKCIRVMVLADIDYQPKHVYLREASSLRKDLTQKLNIAIDGPAGSGKSTISKIIALKLNILYLDTGAMYRTCALACVKAGVDCADGEKVKKLINKTQIDVKYIDGAQKTYLNGDDVSQQIRTPEISMLASKVSSHECVRIKMVDLQRKIAASGSCVLDGRDIGTNVLPHAPFKFYLTASDEVRANRRLKEDREKGINQSYEEVLNDIRQRDYQDKTRKIAPLVKATDAVEVDTSDMNIQEVSEYILNKIQEKI